MEISTMLVFLMGETYGADMKWTFEVFMHVTNMHFDVSTVYIEVFLIHCRKLL